MKREKHLLKRNEKKSDNTGIVAHKTFVLVLQYIF